ncbi:MAG: dihydropteroate synthase [Planctomycetota bacterium]|nr:MAG: dihydropteroate synthase [Planctomycetota bacterium]
MGVINATPDSFSDGGRFSAPDDAVRAALAQLEEGAAIIDVGGESTRPGAAPVPAEEELRRVLPVIEGLRAQDPEAPISVDTSKALVAKAALAAGADLVNDVTGLRDPRMAEVVAAAGAGLILGHLRGEPRTMQRNPRYDDVLAEVAAELAAARRRALAAGVPAEAIAVDPGIGFGKSLEHNLLLLGNLHRLHPLGPVVVGVSRKSLFGALLGRGLDERLAAGIGVAVACALEGGARLVRTHDVRATGDALRAAWEVHRRREGFGA